MPMYRDPAQRMAEITEPRPRLGPVEEAVLEQRTLDVMERLRRIHNTVPRSDEIHDFYGTLARSPAVFTAFLELGTELSSSATIPPRERELAILRVGWLCGAPYEWGEHVIVARRVGLSEAEIDRVTRGSAAEGWSEGEQAVLKAVEELHADAMITDATWAELARHFDERQLIELPMLVGHYHMTAFVQNALRIQLSPRNRGLVPVGDPA